MHLLVFFKLALPFRFSFKIRNTGPFSLLAGWSFCPDLLSAPSLPLAPSLFGPLKLLRTAYLPLTYILLSSFASLSNSLSLSVTVIHTLL